MKIEHVAYQVKDATAAAEWYGAHMGFSVRRGQEKPFPVYFLADESGAVMIEIYSNPSVVTPDYAAMDPLILHLAFVCNTVPETIQRLEAVGATLLSGPDTTPAGDTLAMLRDPWGLAIQLCQRAELMV
jgi:catechol 2,3-dioxygenase-like lactoylglutathione lyase family enzyme